MAHYIISIICGLVGAIALIHFIILVIQIVVGFTKSKDKLDCLSFSVEKSQIGGVSIVIPLCDESSSLLRKTIESCQKVEDATKIIEIENSKDIEAKKRIEALCTSVGQGWIDKVATIHPDQKACKNNFVHICNCTQRPFDMPCQSTTSATVAHGHQKMRLMK